MEEQHPYFFHIQYMDGAAQMLPKPKGGNPDLTNVNTIFSYTDN